MDLSLLFYKLDGAKGDRTPDLRTASATLSQLSYGPTALKSTLIILLSYGRVVNGAAVKVTQTIVPIQFPFR